MALTKKQPLSGEIWRLLLCFYYLSCLNRATIATMSIQNVRSSIHVTIAHHPLCGGTKKPAPEWGSTAYRGTAAPLTGYLRFREKSTEIQDTDSAKKPSSRLTFFLCAGRIIIAMCKRRDHHGCRRQWQYTRSK